MTRRRCALVGLVFTLAACGNGAASSPERDGGHGEPGALHDAAREVSHEDAAGRNGDAPSLAEDARAAYWSPPSGVPVHYHWQLEDAFTAPADVIPSDGDVVYDIDGEDNDAATVAALHALGPNVKVVCYVDVGTWESYRADASSFPASVLGNPNGWPGEKWLDVRQQTVLLPIMKKRLEDWCVAKGFDALEPDNLDGWQNDPGFPLTEAENLSYDLAIASLAHGLGLSVGLKNLPENAPSLEPHFDWALNEQCFEFGECGYFESSFIPKGKAVFDVEYDQAPDCASASGEHLNAQRRDINLVAPGKSGYLYQPCVADTRVAW